MAVQGSGRPRRPDEGGAPGGSRRVAVPLGRLDLRRERHVTASEREIPLSPLQDRLTGQLPSPRGIDQVASRHRRVQRRLDTRPAGKITLHRRRQPHCLPIVRRDVIAGLDQGALRLRQEIGSALVRISHKSPSSEFGPASRAADIRPTTILNVDECCRSRSSDGDRSAPVALAAASPGSSTSVGPPACDERGRGPSSITRPPPRPLPAAGRGRTRGSRAIPRVGSDPP